MIRSSISGISCSNSGRTKSGWQRDSTIFTRWPCLRTSRITAFTRSPTWWLSPGICSLRGSSASLLPSETIAVPASTRVTVPDDQFALLPRELVEDRVRLGLANLLDHHLLGGLGRDAAERLGVEFDLPVAGDDVPGALVDGDEHALLDAEVPLGRDLDGGGDAAEDRFARDLPVLVELVHEFDNGLTGVFVLGHRRSPPHQESGGGRRSQ